MPIDPTRLLKHVNVENPQFEAYAPLDGPLMPLVGITTIDGVLYRFVRSEGNIATLRELTVKEFSIAQAWPKEMKQIVEE